MSAVRRGALHPGERLVIKGGMANVDINGGLGKGAQLIVSGGMNEVTIHGYLDVDSLVRVSGGMNTVRYSGKHPTARVEDRGGMNEVTDTTGGRKDPPDRSGLEFSEFSIIGSRPPRPPRPPKPPKPPRPPRLPGLDPRGDAAIWSLWSSEETYPVEENHDTVTIQKSNRPRELWGT